MSILPLVIAPDPIFKKKAEKVGTVTDSIRKIMDDMLDTLHAEHGVGMGAPMVGILKRIVVVESDESGEKKVYFMADPEIIEKSDETQVYLEASLCFPGISADIERPKYVKISYLDYDGKPQIIEAEGFLSTCFQHEIDYLDGKVFLDYMSKMKRDRLISKMQKAKKHGHACSHGCEH